MLETCAHEYAHNRALLRTHGHPVPTVSGAVRRGSGAECQSAHSVTSFHLQKGSSAGLLLFEVPPSIEKQLEYIRTL